MRLINLPIDNLRTLITIIDLGSYTKAAQRLGRTQPAITLQIQRLQELAGCRILKSGGRDFTLTDEGELLVRYARQILRLNDDIASRLMNRKPEGVVRIGLPTDYAVAFLQRVLINFMEQNRDVQLEISCDLSNHTLERISLDELDLAIAMYGEGQNGCLAFSWAERPIWVAAANSDIHLRDPVPIAAHDKGCEYRDRMIRALDSIGRPWRIVYSNPGISGLQEAVKAGLGVTALTKRTLMRGMRVLTEGDGFPPLPDIRIGVHYKHSNLSTAALMLVSYIVQSLHDSGQNDIIRIDQTFASPLDLNKQSLAKNKMD
jgi:DNA-binding transcriptional LysR family regulator